MSKPMKWEKVCSEKQRTLRSDARKYTFLGRLGWCFMR